MSFRLSPGVTTREIDLTTIVPNVSASIAAIGGVFSWGPVESAQLISNEDELRRRYGKPINGNFETWLSASSFLTYANSLYVSRAASEDPTKTLNAVAGPVPDDHVGILIKNEETYDADQRVDFTEIETGIFEFVPSVNYWSESNNAFFAARYPGELGNSLKVLVCDSANAYSSNVFSTDSNTTIEIEILREQNFASVKFINTDDSNTAAENVAEHFLSKVSKNDYLYIGNTEIGFQYVQVDRFVLNDRTTEIVYDSNTQSYNFTADEFESDNGTTTLSFRVNLDNRLYLSVNDNNSLALTANTSASSIQRLWEGSVYVNGAPGTSTYVEDRGGSGDEVHVVVLDEDGRFSGTPGTALEVFENLSRVREARGIQGGSIYYPEVLRQSSRYIYSLIAFIPEFTEANSAITEDYQASANFNGIAVPEDADQTWWKTNVQPLDTTPFAGSFKGGINKDKEYNITLASLARAYDVFKSPEDIDVSIIIVGKSIGGVHGEGLTNYVSDNIVDFRKDCVFVTSGQFNDVVKNPFQEADSLVEFRNALRSTSYGVMDSGYKLMYDRYNEVYRYIPTCGDVAGLMAYTDEIRDPWFSPAGFNRGNIRNITRLAYNPDRTDRDLLYSNGVNPIVTFPGQGTVLYGDKTLLNKPSAFNRINVRRLFITLEKAIARFAKFSLFELNDPITRSNFRNAVEPYLRDVQGRRGIYDFRVICDETNNTGEVIDRNEFVGDIYIKPARSINFIQLNFIAVRTDVEFNEIVGNFG